MWRFITYQIICRNTDTYSKDDCICFKRALLNNSSNTDQINIIHKPIRIGPPVKHLKYMCKCTSIKSKLHEGTFDKMLV